MDRNFSSDQFARQLKYLGYSEKENVYLREFAGKNPKADDFREAGIESKDFFVGVKPSVSRTQFYHVAEKEERKQDEQRGLYFVVNGQGDKDVDVKWARAIFVEHDHKEGLTREQQIDLWKTLGLPEPTFQVESRNGIQQYWGSKEQIGLDEWKELQEDMIAFTGSDPKNKNPSRVFRVAGSYHVQKDIHGNFLPDFQCNIINESGVRYYYKELRAAIPFRQLQSPVATKSTNTLAQPATIAQPVDDDYVSSNPDCLPLTDLMSIEHRTIADHGIAEGGRNNGLAAFVRDAIGVENWCQSNGIRYMGTAQGLLEYANDQCAPPLEARELDTIWLSAQKDNPTPCLDEEKLINCVEAFNKKNKNNKKIAKSLGPALRKLSPEDQAILIANTAKIAAEKKPKTTLPPVNEYFSNVTKDEVRTIVEYHQKTPGIYEARGAYFGFFLEEYETKEFKLSIQLTDFTLVITKVINDNVGGIYELLVNPIYSAPKTVQIPATSCLDIRKFREALTIAYGRALDISLDTNKLIKLFAALYTDYINQGGNDLKAAPYRGRQIDGVWVFENMQFTANGELTTEDESGWIHQPSYKQGERIPSPKFAPQNEGALAYLLCKLKEYRSTKHLLPLLYVVAGQIQGLYSKEILAHHNGLVMVNATGDAGSGKSLAATVASSLVGMPLGSGKISVSALFEYLHYLSGISYVIDDPHFSSETEQDWQILYNLGSREKRNVYQKPKASILVTSNHKLGSSSQAFLTRVLNIPVPIPNKNDINQSMEAEISRLLASVDDQPSYASSCFSSLLSFGWDALAVDSIQEQLKPYHADVHDRISKGIAVLTFYAQKLAALCGISKNEILNYAKELSQHAAESGTTTNSLDDFLAKCEYLQQQDLIGPWVYKVDNNETTEEQSIYLKFDSLWAIFSKEFKGQVSYNAAVVKDLLKASGAVTTTTRLVNSKGQYQVWRNRLIAHDMDLDDSWKKIASPAWVYKLIKPLDPVPDETHHQTQVKKLEIDYQLESKQPVNEKKIIEFTLVDIRRKAVFEMKERLMDKIKNPALIYDEAINGDIKSSKADEKIYGITGIFDEAWQSLSKEEKALINSRLSVAYKIN